MAGNALHPPAARLADLIPALLTQSEPDQPETDA
jgi:hypothetical protein